MANAIDERRRNFLAAAGTLCVPLATPAWAQGRDYPSRLVRIVVGFPAGGATDILARIVAEPLALALKQAVVVDNKPGADGIIAVDNVARSAPDGYTLTVASGTAMAINPLVHKKLPYDPQKDFAPVTLLGSQPLLLVVNPKVPVSSLSEFVAWSRTLPDGATCATASVGQQLALELLKNRAGGSFRPIPYKGSAQLVQAIVSGEVAAGFLEQPTVIQQILAGGLKPLAISAATRALRLPAVPTMAELGQPSVNIRFWFGLFAPAGTPAAVIGKLQSLVNTIVQQPEIIERMAALGIEPSGDTPEALRALIASDLNRYASIMKMAGMKPE
jgi:tripartite-type tricarboxylate transporter receptor subunit TctC